MDHSFRGAIVTIPDPLAVQMRGVSWHARPRCPAFDELALLRMNHWTFPESAGESGEGLESSVSTADGELIVARAVADELCDVFAALFAARFPIARMAPICHFGGDDLASMDANNCSAFNFRTIAGTDKLSQHALGFAVDINPVQNPWVRRAEILPPAGADYLERDPGRPGLISRPGSVTEAFDAIGWSWGGDWPDVKDYHHFQKYPRHGI